MLDKYFFHIVVAVLLLGGCAGPKAILDDESVKNRLIPGLSVLYFNGMYRHVWRVPDGDSAFFEKGRPGSPISMINSEFGDGEVFDSGRNRGVGVQIKGYLHLEQQGIYQFQAMSNDGVEIIVDGARILIDPDVHSDRLSKIGTLAVQDTGWHTLMVKFFQRRGTATLKIYWKKPGDNAFELIPAKVYGHLSDDPRKQ